jgi:hypothetical protein
MDRIAAETLALEALGWLAAQEGGLEAFLATSGLNAGELRHRAGEAELLAAVMDFLLASDSLSEGFCASLSLDAQALHRARRALPGAAPD